MPENTADRLAEHDIHFAKIDLVLERLTKQGETFESAVKQFETAITRLQSQADFRGKVINIVGSVIMIAIGAIIGQFVHIHP